MGYTRTTYLIQVRVIGTVTHLGRPINPNLIESNPIDLTHLPGLLGMLLSWVRNIRGGVWFVFSNNYFQFLNNISRISTHFFTHTYFQKCF